jgi:hypothetical protein
VLFVAAFAMDASVMTLVYLASMLVVPLLAQKPVKLYWKALLVYTEVRSENRCPFISWDGCPGAVCALLVFEHAADLWISMSDLCCWLVAVAVYCDSLQILLILQYSYLTAARCLCIAGDSGVESPSSSSGSTGCVWALDTDPTATRHVFDVLGLHRTAAGVLPLFLIYLAVLMYNYLLGSSHPVVPGLLEPGSAQSAQSVGLILSMADPALATHSSYSDADAGLMGQQAGRSRAGGAGAAVVLVAALQGWASKLWTLQRLVAHRLWYHLRSAGWTKQNQDCKCTQLSAVPPSVTAFH